MAVRVVSPPKDLRRITCSGCGYELEFRPADVRTFHPDYDTGDTDADRHQYITCPRPDCRKHIRIPDPPPDYDL